MLPFSLNKAVYIFILIEEKKAVVNSLHCKGCCAIVKIICPNASFSLTHFPLRGHLGVPDTVSESLIVPLNYLVILHMTSEIECFHRYWNSASRTRRYPLIAQSSQHQCPAQYLEKQTLNWFIPAHKKYHDSFELCPLHGVHIHSLNGYFIWNGNSIPKLLRRVSHSQIKIKCSMKMWIPFQ